MFDKIFAMLKSHSATKRACIFCAAFALTISLMAGSHNLLLGRSDSLVPVQKETNAAANEQTGIETAISTKTAYAATREAEITKISNDEKSDDASDTSKADTSESTKDISTAGDESKATMAVEKSEKTSAKDSSAITEKTKKKTKKKTTTPEGFVYSAKIPLARELQEYTYTMCKERGLEYELILAIMWRESRFATNAVHYNSNGTRDNGIMQINDINKKWLRENYGITDLMDPYQNINAGTALLGELTQKHGPHNAMLAYQYGEGGMAQKLRQGYTTSHATEIAYSQREYYRALI